VTAPRKPTNRSPYAPIRVGDRSNQVSVGVKPDGRIWVNAYIGTGVTALISEGEARELHNALGLLLGMAD
jgi:hypothetical protein